MRKLSFQSFQEERRDIQKLIQRVKASLEDAPEGKLRCEMARGKYPQYYLVSKEGKDTYPNGRYLKKGETEVARRLAQKEYDLQILELLEKQEKAIQYFADNYQEDQLNNVYRKLPEAKRRLVKPYIPTDEDFLEQWNQVNREEKNEFPIKNGFLTERGEVVRSKSEKMIADKLYYKQIPYKYEVPLKLNNYGIIYPDFTLLNVRTRKTYYLEHFGMMDNAEYCKKALEKIEAYEMNHIFQNETLLVTMESSLKGINMQQAEALFERFLI